MFFGITDGLSCLTDGSSCLTDGLSWLTDGLLMSIDVISRTNPKTHGMIDGFFHGTSSTQFMDQNG